MNKEYAIIVFLFQTHTFTVKKVKCNDDTANSAKHSTTKKNLVEDVQYKKTREDNMDQERVNCSCEGMFKIGFK